MPKNWVFPTSGPVLVVTGGNISQEHRQAIEECGLQLYTLRNDKAIGNQILELMRNSCKFWGLLLIGEGKGFWYTDGCNLNSEEIIQNFKPLCPGCRYIGYLVNQPEAFDLVIGADLEDFRKKLKQLVDLPPDGHPAASQAVA